MTRGTKMHLDEKVVITVNGDINIIIIRCSLYLFFSSLCHHLASIIC